MAQYHMTPDGPKPCRARKGKCPYSHYTTPEGAVAAAELETRKADAGRARKNLETRLNNLSPDEAVQPVHDLNQRGDFGPQLIQKMDEIEERTGTRPEFVPGISSAQFDGPGGKINFMATRGYQIEGNPPRVIPTWTLSTSQEFGPQKINKKSEVYPLGNEAEGKVFKRDAYAMLNDSTSRAWPGDPETANAKRDQAVDSFVNVVNTCETAERGAVAADNVGFSNFSKSTNEKIEGQADWSESIMRGQEVREVLASPKYRDLIPEVQMTVQDSKSKKSPNYWTARRSYDGWSVHLTREGKTESKPVYSKEELQSEIYGFSRNEMKSSEERAQRSSSDTAELFSQTELAIDAHDERTRAKWAREEEEQVAQEHEELYHDPEPKKGLNKLFSLFN